MALLLEPHTVDLLERELRILQRRATRALFTSGLPASVVLAANPDLSDPRKSSSGKTGSRRRARGGGDEKPGAELEQPLQARLELAQRVVLATLGKVAGDVGALGSYGTAASRRARKPVSEAAEAAAAQDAA